MTITQLPTKTSAEGRALIALAEKYDKAFARLVEAERNSGSRVDRVASSDAGPFYDLDGVTIADMEGTPLMRGQKIKLAGGEVGELVRVDRRTVRAVVRLDDDTLVARVAHAVKVQKRPGRKPASAKR